MATVLDIVTRALNRSGILTKTETPTNDEAQDGLNALNDLLESWGNSTSLTFSRVTESFALTDSVASYTIGSGGDFDTTRPLKIVQAHVRQSNIDYNLDIVSDEIYQSIIYKSNVSIPYILNYTNEFPLGTINLYPEPPSGYTLFITSEKPLTSYTALTDRDWETLDLNIILW